MRIVSSTGWIAFLAVAGPSVEAFHVPTPSVRYDSTTTKLQVLPSEQSQHQQLSPSEPTSSSLSVATSRREMIFQSLLGAATTTMTMIPTEPVWASGGATAGKYTYVTVNNYVIKSDWIGLQLQKFRIPIFSKRKTFPKKQEKYWLTYQYFFPRFTGPSLLQNVDIMDGSKHPYMIFYWLDLPYYKRIVSIIEHESSLFSWKSNLSLFVLTIHRNWFSFTFFETISIALSIGYFQCRNPKFKISLTHKA